jgi:hypothetical protein
MPYMNVRNLEFAIVQRRNARHDNVFGSILDDDFVLSWLGKGA